MHLKKPYVDQKDHGLATVFAQPTDKGGVQRTRVYFCP